VVDTYYHAFPWPITEVCSRGRFRRTHDLPKDEKMPKNPSLLDVTGRIAEITSGPSDDTVQRVIKALQEHRHSPVEVQARAVIAAVVEADSWRPDATTEAETASRRAVIDAALPDFERVVEAKGILKPKP
jgi:hypothetical protein